jgi:hypothetical protein
MKAFLETTEWELDHPVPNHIYLLNDSKDKMYAYIKAGTDNVFEFKKPIKFSVSRRKFKEVPNTWGYTKPKDEPVGRNWIVPGSKGDKYSVTENEGQWACTCSGFTFRGRCRHIAELSGSPV